MDVLSRILPFFLLIAAGAIAARSKVLDGLAARGLSSYVFWIGFPALLVHALAAAPPPDADVGKILAAYGLGLGAALALPLIIGRLRGWRREARAGAAMAASVGNTAFLGVPIATAVFGKAVSGATAAMIAVDCTVVIGLATAVLVSAEGDAQGWRTLRRTLFNPLVVAAALGAVLCLTGLALPGPIDRALGLLAATASPVGLVALGVVVGSELSHPRAPEAPSDAAAVAVALTIKLVVAPLIVWLLAGLFRAPPLFQAAATLLAACPSAVSVFIQTRTLGVFARGGAFAVVISALISAASLSLLAVVLAHR